MGTFLPNAANAPIGGKGLKLLTIFHFPKVEELWLNHCNISTDGLAFLTRADWPYLRIVDLGIFMLIEVETALTMLE